MMLASALEAYRLCERPSSDAGMPRSGEMIRRWPQKRAKSLRLLMLRLTDAVGTRQLTQSTTASTPRCGRPLRVIQSASARQNRAKTPKPCQTVPKPCLQSTHVRYRCTTHALQRHALWRLHVRAQTSSHALRRAQLCGVFTQSMHGGPARVRVGCTGACW